MKVVLVMRCEGGGQQKQNQDQWRGAQKRGACETIEICDLHMQQRKREQ